MYGDEDNRPIEESERSVDMAPSHRDLTRRGFLRAATAGSAGAAIHLDLGVSAPRIAHAQPPATPKDALKALMDGNARFTANQMISFDEDLDLIRKDLEESQQPFSAVLACADSRVPVEIVFDQTLGRVFVTRVAGNIATAEIIASLEYGVLVLGAKVIMVLGHGSCGAVSAAIAAKPAPGQITALYAPLRPAVNAAGPNVEAAIRANAKIQAVLLRDASPPLAALIKAGKLLVVPAYYDLATGKVTLLT
jgi:carbonic anhydrase